MHASDPLCPNLLALIARVRADAVGGVGMAAAAASFAAALTAIEQTAGGGGGDDSCLWPASGPQIMARLAEWQQAQVTAAAEVSK